MSSHQNSTFNGEPMFALAPRAGRTASPHRAIRSGQPSARIESGPDEIWGRYNNYRANGIVTSAIVHLVLLGLLLSGALFGHQIVAKVLPRETVTLIAPPLESYALPVAKKVVSGGGGGGDHDKLPAPKGALPKPALTQITPPAIVVRNEKPRLAVEPTVVAPPQIAVAANHVPNLGVSAPAVMPSAPPSNGTGSGGGIGSGSGGGVGVGHGPGVGAGSGGGIGGGVYKVGAGISAPEAITAPDPSYTEEARRAKTQGTCVLWLIVDATGHPRDIKVVRGLGYGLDAKAVEAVQQWRFQPAMKNGKPVDVQISVEVAFNLY
jgi:periplasmic protein TonB